MLLLASYFQCSYPPNVQLTCEGLFPSGVAQHPALKQSSSMKIYWELVITSASPGFFTAEILMNSTAPVSSMEKKPSQIASWSAAEVEPQLYIWGEGNSCGQEKDVCLPMYLNTAHLRFPLQSVRPSASMKTFWLQSKANGFHVLTVTNREKRQSFAL